VKPTLFIQPKFQFLSGQQPFSGVLLKCKRNRPYQNQPGKQIIVVFNN
jgi:hypothetical protein